VTGVSVTTFVDIWKIIVGIMLCIAFIPLLAVGASGGIAVLITLSILSLVFGVGLFISYHLTRVTLLKIEYAGGAIGFDIKWFPMEESQQYQKSLFLAKDKIFEGE
jgi:hypothetical protein